ncbi:MAG: hypothetical protein WCS37_12140 [Chloroflexota bacterium]|nr:hypothetical protein [Chloroflexota bacterium]
MSQEIITTSEEETVLGITRADPAFKEVTGKMARASGLNVVGAELPQILAADFVLEIPDDANLENTLFSYLKGYRYAVLDFKGPNDRLNMPKLLNNFARTALFCIKNPQVKVSQVVNLLVCSRYPQELLRPIKGVCGFTRPDSVNQPWLWYGKFTFQEIIIIVCRDLPIESRFFEWLVFIPADNSRWKETVKAFFAANRLDLVSFAHALHPKEFETMELDLDFKKIYRDLDPKERERLHDDWADVLQTELPEMALTRPNSFKRLLASVETKKVIEALSDDALDEALADELTDERFEEIARRRQAKKQQQEPTP